MLLLDVLIRYPTIAMLLILSGLCVRDGWKHMPTRLAAILCFVIALLLLGTSHPDLALPEPMRNVIWVLSLANLTWVWLTGRAMFEDDFKLGRLEWAGFAALLLCDMSNWWLRYHPEHSAFVPMATAIYLAIAISMMLHLGWVAIKGRSDDTVESRRKFRLYFVLALVVIVLLIIISEKAIGGVLGDDGPVFNLARAAAIFPLTLAGLIWLLRAHPERLAFETVQPVGPVPSAIDPRDALLHERLVAEMEENHAYTEAGLTIRGLAEKLGAPEHHLRGLINKGLGYRNFSAYLNSYRIEAVKRAMADPENARLPVLSMAMDVGYNSLAPFNRAFKSVTGQTPSEYRKTLSPRSD